jgi:integrase
MPTVQSELNQAGKWDRLRVNPCLKIDKPKKGNSQMSPLVLEDFGKFVVALNEKDLFVPALFLALTAVRRNEMLGIYKDDVDLAEGTVFIERQQMRDLETNEIGVGPTKTGRRRIVPLPPEVNAALADHMAKTAGKLLSPSRERPSHSSTPPSSACSGMQRRVPGSPLAHSGSAASFPPPVANRAWLARSWPKCWATANA